MPDYSTLPRHQKILCVAITACPSQGGLHLLVDSTGVKMPGDPGKTPDWRGMLVRDEYQTYARVIGIQLGRIAAGCLAHARRKCDELLRDSSTDRRGH